MQQQEQQEQLFRHVLTAAHCVVEDPESCAMEEGIVVYAGMYSTEDLKDPDEKEGFFKTRTDFV